VNRWECSAVIDYGCLPFTAFPLMVYFKEEQTEAGTWGKFEMWGKLWSGPSSTAPQVHFFPGICNADAWEKEMVLRGAKKAATSSKTSKAVAQT
jgi:hypothetical protein